MKTPKSPLWLILVLVFMTGCSSQRKAELASGNDPQQAVAEVNQLLDTLHQEQVDVLAFDPYQKGRIYLKDARRALETDAPPETVVDNAAIAKAYFEDATQTAKGRRPNVERILAARDSALSAGVRKSDALIERLLSLDADLRDETKNFSRSLAPEDFSKFQKRYLELETRAVQFSQLDNAKQVIHKAKENDAEDLAPKSLRSASIDYETAMNTIAQSPRSPDIYKESVQAALASAKTLDDVMNVILGAKGTPEHIALQIVKQKRALGELTSSLQSTQQTLQEKENQLKRTEGELKSREERLEAVSTQVRFQQAMDQARKEIPAEDALVYQQGNKLVFRLKRINFPSGTAVIPGASKLLLNKVAGIIKKLDAEKVVVQGHTDSVGSTEFNQKLSTERAKAVADYMYSLGAGYAIGYTGYGEAYPIASNETAGGRATNRRVDLVVSVKE